MLSNTLPEVRKLPLILGGTVDIADIVGRDEYVSRMWKDLEHTSIVINEIRRFSKSTILRLMESNPPPHWICVRTSVQDIRTKSSLAELTLEVLLNHTAVKEQVKQKIRSFGQKTKEIKVNTGVIAFSFQPDFKINAFSVFRSLLKDVDKQLAESNQKLVIIWDEFPDAIGNIKKEEGDSVAEDIMSLFRMLREDDGSKNIRWILTGSVGFHHILKGQRKLINDMVIVGVPPLSHEWTCWLAKGLLLGIGIEHSDVQAISKISGGIPFVLEMLIKYIRDNGLDVPNSDDGARELLIKAACSPEYGINWAPLLERVDHYYEKKKMPIVMEILDILGHDSLNTETLFNNIIIHQRSQGKRIGNEDIGSLLTSLIEDHYIQFNSNTGEFSWLHEPLQTIWLARRWRIKA